MTVSEIYKNKKIINSRKQVNKDAIDEHTICTYSRAFLLIFFIIVNAKVFGICIWQRDEPQWIDYIYTADV